MKRGSPLKRKTPLRAKRASLSRKPMKRKPPRRLKAPGSDPAYLAQVRLLGCCAPLSPPTRCVGLIEAHHPRHLAGGVGRKATDENAIGLCMAHHSALHSKAQPFRGFSRSELIEWQNLRVAETRRRLGRAG